MSFAPKQRALMRESRGKAHVYSVLFPNPVTPVGIREDQARGFRISVAHGEGSARNDFDRVPIFQRPIFNATWNGKNRRWEDFVAYGEATFSWTPTEEKREVIYRCQPFWYQLDLSAPYGPYRVSVTDRPMEGFTLAPMFRNGTDPVHRPVFEMAVDKKGVPHSRAGALPLRATPEELVGAVRRYDEAARLESVKDWFSDALLQLVEFATWNVGAVMRGNCGELMAKTGGGIVGIESSLGDLGNDLGCVWRGKENPWKNVNSCLWDLLGQKRTNSDGSVRVTLFHLTNEAKYTGELNQYYDEVGIYLPDMKNGYASVGGWQLSKGGIPWPCEEAVKGVASKALAYLATDSTLSEKSNLIHVGVGGGTDSILLPSTVLPSPFHWEAVQTKCDGCEYFGGRLVLEEA